ncbi:MAG: hypothetical protein COV76_05745 [Candidatus Omnitrophica bacterium CG11_big_fil_rev_8_21_14_0_20_64_10]|nr:MAG: hypothetical protein COV76_05745 [Candidatus Omnitrophica bacterium CG11_big_fil_rev_8_21_14_0_20_64_10]
MSPLFWLVFSAALAFFWAAASSAWMVHPPRLAFPLTPLDFGIPHRTLTLTTSDGIPLSAWWIPDPHPRGIILMLHGYGAGKGDLLEVAAALHRVGGYHLLLLDLRGHGASGGGIVSFGHREKADLEAAFEYLSREESSTRLPIAIYGVSMGGAVALLNGNAFPGVRAIVTDSTYASVERAIARTLWLAYHIPRFPFSLLLVGGAAFRWGVPADRLNPVRAVEALRCGLLLIHGAEDSSVPPEEARRLYEAKRTGVRELWLVPEAGHAASFRQNEERYATRVLKFIDEECRNESG